MKPILVFILILISVSSFAWDGSVSGKISRIDVAGGNNYAFRIFLDGLPELCGNEHVWAYLNEADSNYTVCVSVLLAAKAQQNTVTIYSNRKDGDETGYYNICYISSTR